MAGLRHERYILRIYPIVPLIAAFNIFPSEKGRQGNIAEM